MIPAGGLLAHGIGGRTDLPLPVWMFGYGAAAALVISFAGLAVFWPTSRFGSGLAAGAGSAARSPVGSMHVVARAVGVALFFVILGAATFGPESVASNLAPVAVYVLFWVGLTVVCGLVVDVWRPINPFATFGSAFAAADPSRHYRLGHWPAAAGLAAFVWVELVYPSRAEPRVLAVLIVAYTVIVLAGAASWGSAFLQQGETFAAWFGLLGAMAPIGRDATGRLRVRTPLAGLAGVQVLPGTVGLVVVALGSTAFDGLTRTAFWTGLIADRTPWGAAPFATAGLAWTIGLVAIAYTGAMRIASRLTDRPLRELIDGFAHTLVPIAFAYAVAHYISLLLLEGQAAIALVSDPFGREWNLFGTADRPVDYRLISATTVAYLQVAAIVLGHIAGVVLAHDRALALFAKKQATRSQYPLLAVMVALTVGGLGLLLGG